MKTNYVLIDFENVQPDNLALLKSQEFKVVVFVDDKQSKISFDLAAAMQSLGDRAEYIKIESNGSNALDFHIAFYIGLIAANDKNCHFHIISKDAGFDPLIRHLKTKKILAQREQDISKIFLVKTSNSRSQTEKTTVIINFLIASGNAKPRTIQSLSNSLSSLFQKKLADAEIHNLVEDLVLRKIIITNGNKVSYQLPEKPQTTAPTN